MGLLILLSSDWYNNHEGVSYIIYKESVSRIGFLSTRPEANQAYHEINHHTHALPFGIRKYDSCSLVIIFLASVLLRKKQLLMPTNEHRKCE